MTRKPTSWGTLLNRQQETTTVEEVNITRPYLLEMMASIESHSISGSIQLSTPAARGESSKLSTWTYTHTHTLQRAGRRRSIPRRSWWWNLKYRSTVVVSFPSILSSSLASCISFVCQPFFFYFSGTSTNSFFCCFVLFVCCVDRCNWV
jgi:hypothetical protein